MSRRPTPRRHADGATAMVSSSPSPGSSGSRLAPVPAKPTTDLPLRASHHRTGPVFEVSRPTSDLLGVEHTRCHQMSKPSFQDATYTRATSSASVGGRQPKMKVHRPQCRTGRTRRDERANLPMSGYEPVPSEPGAADARPYLVRLKPPRRFEGREVSAVGRVLLVGCGQGPGADGPKVLETPEAAVLVAGPAEGVDGALIAGAVTIVDGCLGIGGDIAVWPSGTRVTHSEGPVIDVPGLETLNVGDDVEGAGGYMRAKGLNDSSSPTVPRVLPRSGSSGASARVGDESADRVATRSSRCDGDSPSIWSMALASEEGPHR